MKPAEVQTPPISQSPESQLLLSQLKELDAKAEAHNADWIREKIQTVIEDLSMPAGKENARLAIPEIREDLKNLGRHSERRVRLVKEGDSEMNFDDEVA